VAGLPVVASPTAHRIGSPLHPAEETFVKREIWNSLALVMGVVALTVGGPWLIGHLRSLPSGKTLAARADQRIVTLEVGGMTCGGCAATVKSRLADLPGVRTVEVRYPQRRAYVVCD
jgi:hypothetical protein